MNTTKTPDKSRKTVILVRNAVGMGTRTQLRILIEYITTYHRDDIIVRFSRSSESKDSLLYKIYRAMRTEADIFYLGILKRHPIIIFANYGLLPYRYKTIIVRHPSLIYGKIISAESSSRYAVLLEVLRTVLFKISLLNFHKIVLQLDSHRSMFRSAWKISEDRISTLWNFQKEYPVNVVSLEERVPEVRLDKNTLRAYYPSRYYSYKNFEALFDIVADHNHTADRQIIVNVFLEERQLDDLMYKSRLAPEWIINHGETDNETVRAVASECDFMVFPSEYETFGNGLIEAIRWHKPTLAHDRRYCHEIVGDCGAFYNFKSADTAKFSIAIATLDTIEPAQFDRRAACVPDIKRWLNEIICIARE